MTRTLDEALTRYRDELKAYLARPGEVPLKRAYEIGRDVLDDGGGLLDIATIHFGAVADLVAEEKVPAFSPTVLAAAGAFFVEALAPFEMTHRGFREANLALRSVNESLEAKSTRIAHALHDEAGPLLVTVHLALKALARDVAPPIAERLDAVRAQLNEIEEQLRHLAHEFRPLTLEQFGLGESLRFLAEGIASRNGLRVDVEVVLEHRLEPTVEITLYRLVQEGLTNVIRHARARQARARIVAENGMIHCTVADDGVGMDPSRAEDGRGLGLTGMHERVGALGGTLRVRSAPGLGTEIHATIPKEV